MKCFLLIEQIVEFSYYSINLVNFLNFIKFIPSSKNRNVFDAYLYSEKWMVEIEVFEDFSLNV